MSEAKKSLDERWLEFVQRTAPIVDAHPCLLPLRQQVFKMLIERRVHIGRREKLGYLAKLLVHREVSNIQVEYVDVAFWLDNNREVLVEAILPVWQHVQQLGLNSVVIASPQVAKALDLPSRGTVRFRAPYRRGEVNKWKNVFHDLRALFPHRLDSPSLDTFLLLGRLADSYAEEIKRIFSRIRPKILVLPVDQFMPGSSACVVARELGIPSLVLLHGAVSAYNAPLTADSMAVWGEVSRQQMCHLGVANDKLLVLGSPRHDHPPYLGDSLAKQRLMRALGCDSEMSLTFFSNGNDLLRNTEEAVVGCAEWLAEAAEKLESQLNVLVRLHPNEDGSIYAGLKRLRVFKYECDLGTTLAGSDIVAALCSTALLEGLLYGKPVLQFRDDQWPELADNWQRGLAARVTSATDLVDILRRLLDEREQSRITANQQAHKGQVFANRGHAAEAIAAYVVREYT